MGYNMLYNTQVHDFAVNPYPLLMRARLGLLICLLFQGPGRMSGPDWKTQKLWRSWLFVVHLVFSSWVLLFRMYAIKNHEKDIGTWIRKDWQMLFLKLGRLSLFIPLLAIYVVDVRHIENPRIINAVFAKQCTLQPVYVEELAEFRTISVCPMQRF